MTTPAPATVVLGLRENWRQFSLLVLVNVFVGALVGLERTVLPLLAEAEFGVVARTATLSFLVGFGAVKAAANLAAGHLADRAGRRRTLVVGWLLGLPVAPLLAFAPSWSWVVFANALLGANQGLCWSATVIMKIDLVGPRRRGLATGLNEFAGYLAVSGAALLTGLVAARWGLRPAPFVPGIAFAALGLLLSVALVRDTGPHVRLEARAGAPEGGPAAERRSREGRRRPEEPRRAAGREGALPFRDVFALATWRDRALMASSQAGLVNNLNDAVVWALVPILAAGAGLPIGRVGMIAAAYPAAWGIGQLVTGPLSDRVGRKWPIAAGMWAQAVGIAGFAAASGFGAWVASAVLLGLGTALVYPTLLAAVSDVAAPAWRASAIGVYRLWRDGGYVVGGLAAGLTADALGLRAAIAGAAVVTALSGVAVAALMYETLPGRRR